MKKDCELAIRNGKLNKNVTPKVKDINIDHDPLTIQLLRLPEVNLKDHPNLVHSQPCDGSGIHHSERFLHQGSDAWKEARKEMIKYAEEVKSGHGTKDEYMNDAMRWGSMCEDHAVATYINGMQSRKFEKNRTLGNN